MFIVNQLRLQEQVVAGLRNTVAQISFLFKEGSMSNTLKKLHSVEASVYERGSAYLLVRESEWCYSENDMEVNTVKQEIFACMNFSRIL